MSPSMRCRERIEPACLLATSLLHSSFSQCPVPRNVLPIGHQTSVGAASHGHKNVMEFSTLMRFLLSLLYRRNGANRSAHGFAGNKDGAQRAICAKLLPARYGAGCT